MDDLLRPPTLSLSLRAPESQENGFAGPESALPASPPWRRAQTPDASRSRNLLLTATRARHGKLQLGE